MQSRLLHWNTLGYLDGGLYIDRMHIKYQYLREYSTQSVS